MLAKLKRTLPYQLAQDALMLPMHAVEGLAAAGRFTGPLYNILASFYHLTRPLLYFGEDEFLAGVEPGAKLLDLGCGSGYLLQLLSPRFHAAVGLDYDAKMLKSARRLAPRAMFVRGDMLHISARNEAFNAVVSLGAIQCVNYDALAAEIRRVLLPEGQVFLLIENRAIPFFAPAASYRRLREALVAHGFQPQKEKKVGNLYMFIQAAKIRERSS